VTIYRSAMTSLNLFSPSSSSPTPATTSSVLAFGLSDLTTGAGLGFAVICADVPYASIAWRGRDALERRFVNPADWQMFALAVNLGFESGPLSSELVVSRVLLDQKDRHGRVVQYHSSQQMELAPASARATLDAHLRAMASSATP
jgi:hypothetical protein